MAVDLTKTSWVHDREHVRFLHTAHADQIESLYRAMQDLPSNLDGVVIETVGPVRTLLARTKRWENRAIFLGDETPEQIDAVLRHFASHDAHCVIEINIANSYVDPPRSWEARLLEHLMQRGCKAGGMRCVWFAQTEPPSSTSQTKDVRIERFEPSDIERYAVLDAIVRPNEHWSRQRMQIEAREGMIHYIGFEADSPASSGSMFVRGAVAYLSYWETNSSHRNRGQQRAGILRRLRDAQAMNCSAIFSVSDYNVSSARNLERCGFKLAYNYLVLTREPVPLH